MEQTCLLLEPSLQAASSTGQLQSPLPKSYSSQRSPWKASSRAGLAAIPSLSYFFLLPFLPAAVSGSLCPPRSTPVHTHLFSLPAGAAPLIISALLPQLELNHLLHITCRKGSYYIHGAGLSPSRTAGSELTTQRPWALAVLVQPTAPTP